MRTIRTTVMIAALGAGLVLSSCAQSDSGDRPASSTSSASSTRDAQEWQPPASSSSSTSVSPPPELSPRSKPPAATERQPPTGDDADGDGGEDVDRSDAEQVAAEAVETWFAWRPVDDAGPLDAIGRTAPLLTDEFRQSSLGDAPVRGPGGDFAAWARKGVEQVDVDVTAEGDQGGRSVDEDTTPLVFSARQTAQAGGREVGTATHVVYVLATRDDGIWAIDDLTPR